jgi:hypothetical protein
MYSGAVIGIISCVVAAPRIDFPVWLIAHTALIAPTAAQPFIQKKSFKIFSRTALGFGTSSYFATGMLITAPLLNIWLFRLLMFVVFGVIYFALTKLRIKFSQDPCKSCPLGTYPICDWNLPRLLEDQEQAIYFKR